MVKNKLKEITLELMSDSAEYFEMKNAADQLYDLFSKHSNFEANAFNHSECVLTNNGKAISPFEAGYCIKEFMRTRQFLKGFVLAIREAQNQFPNQVIKILYAGTGPFATLMLPITTLFSSNEIQFTLLEINAASVLNLEKVIEQFDAKPYIIEIIETDAATYQLKDQGVHHILITETMQRALKKEPQVAITLNLLPQIHKNGLLIPENICISLALIDYQRNMERMQGNEEAIEDCFYWLGNILDFNKQNALLIANAKKEGKANDYFDCQHIEFPHHIDSRFKHLNMMTEIQVYKEVRLTRDQCSLNLLSPVKLGSDINALPKKLIFEYELSDMPHIRWREEK